MRIGQKVLMEFKSGKNPKEVVSNGTANKNTVYKYWKVFQKYQTLSEILWDIIYETA